MASPLLQFPSVDLVALEKLVPHIPLHKFSKPPGGKLSNSGPIKALTVGAASFSSTDDFQRTLNDISSDLRGITTDIGTLSDNVNKSVISGSHDSINGLEAAVRKAYDLAVMIKGDYDNRNVDEAEKKGLLDAAVKAFEDVQRIAEANLKQIGDAHARTVEIEQTRLDPKKQQLDTIARQNASTLENIKNSISDQENSVRTFAESVQQEAASIKTLQEKISSTEVASGFSDGFFTVITLGIGNAINHGPLDPFHLHDQLNNAQNSLASAMGNFTNATNQLTSLNNSLALLQIRLNVQNQVQAAIPTVSHQLSDTMSRIVMLEKQFTPIKDAAAKMLLNIRNVQKNAIVTAAVALTKAEFAFGIISLARDALIDSSLMGSSKQIKDEILNDYGSAVPEDIAAIGKEIDEKLAVLKDVQSVLAVQ